MVLNDVNPRDLSMNGPTLGRGKYGEVVQGKFKGEDVAVKRFFACPLKENLRRNSSGKYIEREISILSALSRHPSLIKFYGAVKHEKESALSQSNESECSQENEDEYSQEDSSGSDSLSEDSVQVSNEYHLVMELLQGGNLRQFWKQQKKSLNWCEIIAALYSAAKGIRHLHLHEVVHRDIKTENLMLDKDGNCKLIDFGLARFINEDSEVNKKKRMTIVGTDPFMAPELLTGENFDEKIDIFSFGIVIAECITQLIPGIDFLNRKPVDLFALNEEEIRENVLPGCPVSLVELAISCTSYLQDERPNASAVCDYLEELLQSLLGPNQELDDKEINCDDLSCGDVKLPKTKNRTSITLYSATDTPSPELKYCQYGEKGKRTSITLYCATEDTPPHKSKHCQDEDTFWLSTPPPPSPLSVSPPLSPEEHQRWLNEMIDCGIAFESISTALSKGVTPSDILTLPCTEVVTVLPSISTVHKEEKTLKNGIEKEEKCSRSSVSFALPPLPSPPRTLPSSAKRAFQRLSVLKIKPLLSGTLEKLGTLLWTSRSVTLTSTHLNYSAKEGSVSSGGSIPLASIVRVEERRPFGRPTFLLRLKNGTTLFFRVPKVPRAKFLLSKFGRNQRRFQLSRDQVEERLALDREEAAEEAERERLSEEYSFEIARWRDALTRVPRRAKLLPLHCGYLYKNSRRRSLLFKNWRKRFFVLTGPALIYYYNDIDRAEIKAVLSAATKAAGVKVTPPETKNSFALSASTIVRIAENMKDENDKEKIGAVRSLQQGIRRLLSFGTKSSNGRFDTSGKVESAGIDTRVKDDEKRFEFEVVRDDNVLRLATTTALERLAWMKKIRCAIAQCS
eukprot:g3843.t1